MSGDSTHYNLSGNILSNGICGECVTNAYIKSPRCKRGLVGLLVITPTTGKLLS